ncbi:MAG: glycosyltransferase family 4 protein [Flavobacterium sp.]|nr:glycosyltransferase family 4 protein [Flavobacterium sp.]
MKSLKQSKMINILFLHQSAEMYGSDKTLLVLLKNLDKTHFSAVVILPFDGPLKKELEKENITVIIAPVLKLYRKMFTPKNIITFFADIKKGFSIIGELNKVYQFDFIYSNTLAVLMGVFYANKTKIKHIWHVHEIIESPKLFKKAFVKLLAIKSNSKIIYNSKATQTFWNFNPKIANKSSVIWNGIETDPDKISNSEYNQFRNYFFQANSNNIVVALVGRISRWKGQMVLLHAINNIFQDNQNIILAFIGAPPPNQEVFLENLQTQIKTFKLEGFVKIIPFQDQIHKIWQTIDIAVVPSTEPEPFGLVAVEAMLAKKPVIGSNHGGLTEIIINNETGFLIEPNNEIALADSLKTLIENPEIRTKFGENGYQRAIKHFSVETYVSSFEKLFTEIIKDGNKINS